MLHSLFIHNYRNLKELKINSLGSVNLFIGKNNTGKSSILEAIAIYVTSGELNQIYQLLGERGEDFKQPDATSNPAETNIKTLSSLFTNRKVSFEEDASISIGSLENSLPNKPNEKYSTVNLRLVKYLDENQYDSAGRITSRKRILNENDLVEDFANAKFGLKRRIGNSSYIIPLDGDRPIRFTYGGIGTHENVQFIRTRNIDREINGKLWDKITLTPKEQYVIDALKIIEPLTERIAFIEENFGERTAVIKLKNTPNVLPLRSMGDGINRILTIILAMVNADNGFLLIDEFENGLHYSVQEQLWKIIFHLSKKLNVQVFITTHSEDCILGFEHILNNAEYNIEGKLIRLDNVNGQIKQVEYTAQELKIAIEQNIETR